MGGSEGSSSQQFEQWTFKTLKDATHTLDSLPSFGVEPLDLALDLDDSGPVCLMLREWQMAVSPEPFNFLSLAQGLDLLA
eukprot:CAMPEP_0181210890 /NCGR_PEP_ID=MMETSP1096-20121128/23484_1 /TAXON_ID=156174 ORGANISM="Chrysochromulina ericina, Strain CCMP281" /NCGR_SAMPLE_ID=MMETSP1096 /ASSEMBLY_ACC=CAM_ASM_000453 /LENGTH=79 /DNA_ID=CAMNT_0023302235 /DNA_START=102 /DNA_END=341 /DNA_ORIENTATION=-